MLDRTQDSRVRATAFDWLSDQVGIYGDVLPRNVLAQGFVMDGRRIPTVGPQGIFKPGVLRDAPLSITTAPEGPYDDAFGDDGLLRYRYRGTDRNHPDNRGLRFAMEHRLPLIYFHGVVPGKCVAAWPVYIVKDNPTDLFVSVAVDDASHIGFITDEDDSAGLVSKDSDTARRVYITAMVRQRFHQTAFRERADQIFFESMMDRLWFMPFKLCMVFPSQCRDARRYSHPANFSRFDMNGFVPQFKIFGFSVLTLTEV